MDTATLKEELHRLIEKDEEDINAGRIYSSQEIKDFIDSWN